MRKRSGSIRELPLARDYFLYFNRIKKIKQMKKLLFFWKELLATFWFLPVLIMVFTVLLSVGLVSLDSSITVSHEGWVRLFLVNSTDSARSLLSTISGAMIGVAGTVFSVTLVALTLASSQFGPRLIKNFMYVRLN
jgi:uncharacterized membrane protein